jgi:glycine cleavage system aminomethyltransferase T
MNDEARVLTAEPPVTSITGTRPVMRSPMTEIHRRLGAELIIQSGWELPRRYQDGDLERSAIKEGLGIADITARGKIDVRGAIGSSLNALPQTRGATLARISRNWALVLTPAAGLTGAIEILTASADEQTMITDATSIYAGIALLGPGVPELLLRLTAIDPSELSPGDAVASQMLRIPTVLFRRELPIIAVEAYVPSEFGRYAWESMFEVAQPLGPEPVGWDALTAEGWR